MSLNSFLMHMSAALPVRRAPVPVSNATRAISENKKGGPPLRPCVVIAGGRESSAWWKYPGHRGIETVGQLTCCLHGGCWHSRTIPLLDNDPTGKDIDLCEQPAKVGRMDVPKCMQLITPEMVMEAIAGWYRGGSLDIR